MKVSINVTVVKNPDGSFSARFKSNFRPENNNLKNVSIDKIKDFFSKEIDYADNNNLISK